MAKELPIIDAEFEDITNAPNLKTKKTSSAPKASKASKSKLVSREAKRVKNPVSEVGRLDVLCGGILQAIYYSNFGGVPPQVANAIQTGATAIVGRQRAKGPEFEFLKALLG